MSMPPTTPGACAALACIWEATAAKPGNVYRGADFEDVTYADFLTSAAVIGPILETAKSDGVGKTVLRAAQATQAAVASNTNLGMLLLMTPLAAVPAEQPLTEGIAEVLKTLSPEDTHAVYDAIRVVQPGGLGEVDDADVQSEQAPEITLVEAMRLAEGRDMIARQYVNQFEQIFLAADLIEQQLLGGAGLGDAIVRAFLSLLSEFPDSLIARKCGVDLASEVSVRAAAVLDSDGIGETSYQEAIRELDFWLRADGHRRNPGTTADLIAAGLFVLLREERLDWPVKFYSP